VLNALILLQILYFTAQLAGKSLYSNQICFLVRLIFSMGAQVHYELEYRKKLPKLSESGHGTAESPIIAVAVPMKR